MFLYLTEHLQAIISGFGLFQYLTFRAILSVLTALFLALTLGPRMIRHLTERQVGQVIRDDGPQSHFSKAGTPTMGGALILVTIVLTILLWGDLDNRYIWVMILSIAAFGWIGWLDDYRKLVRKNPKGLSMREKLFWQSLSAMAITFFLYLTARHHAETQLLIPFLKNIAVDLGILFIPLSYFVIVGSSNAVNLTDGLDGLAIMPVVMVAGALSVFAYVVGHAAFAEYLKFPHIPGAGELVVVGGAVVGAGLGFLWFNAYPAQVFMGDVGALALGAALGTMAVIVRQELVLFIMGGVFVIETLSVMIQVLSYRYTKRRVFRMAPLHHHFELKGWPEPRVIVRFWIITFVLVLLGLATLKIR